VKHRLSPGHLLALCSGLAWGASNFINTIALGRPPFSGASAWLVAPLAAAALYECMRAFWQIVYIAVARDWRQVVPFLRWERGSWSALACALVGGPFATGCFFLSIAFAGVTYGVAVSSIAPALGALVGLALLKDRLRVMAWLGVFVSIAGAVISSYKPPEDAPRHFYLGVMFAILTAFGWAFEAYFAKRAMAHLSAPSVNLIRQVVSAALMTAIVVPLLGGASVLHDAVTSPTMLVLVAAGAAGMVGYLLYFMSVKLIGPGLSMALNLTYVPWTALLAVVLLSEPMTWQLGVGVVVILAGALLVVGGDRGAQERGEVQAPAESP